MMAKRTRKGRGTPCPSCGSTDTIAILYGLYAPDGDALPENIALGGCVIIEGQPLRKCRACGLGFEFRDAGEEADHR
jgi:hypothetical protein